MWGSVRRFSIKLRFFVLFANDYFAQSYMLLFLCSLFHINGKICYCIIWIRVALERCSSESTGTMCFLIEVILCLWDIIWIKFGFIFCLCRHLEKQNELLTEIHRSMSHELHKLQVLFFFVGISC